MHRGFATLTHQVPHVAVFYRYNGFNKSLPEKTIRPLMSSSDVMRFKICVKLSVTFSMGDFVTLFIFNFEGEIILCH